MKVELEKRHGETHFANINFGYYCLFICTLYVCFLFSIRLLRKSKWNNTLWRKIYEVDPFLHLFIIFLPLILPFYHHYSFLTKFSVYIKRIGRVSYVLVTLNLIISLRPPIFPFWQHYNYEELIPLHKWLSRVIILLAVLHGVLFIIKWGFDPNVSINAKLLKKIPNLIGLFVFSPIVILLFTSLAPMRRKHYQLFYISHNLINFTLVFLVALHARPNIVAPYLLINSVLLIIHGLNKIITSRTCEINYKIISKHSKFVLVSLPTKELFPNYISYFGVECDTDIEKMIPPGSHLRISPYSVYNPKYWFIASHPYTIASYDANDIKLIINETKFKLIPDKHYTVNLLFPNKKIHDFLIRIQQEEKIGKLILIAGGSGISLMIPLLKYIENHRDQMKFDVKIIWIVKDYYDYKFLKKHIELEKIQKVDVYVTYKLNIPEEEQEDGVYELFDNSLNYGRFNFSEDLKECIVSTRDTTANSTEENRVGVNYLISCGPESLIRDCNTFAKANNVNLLTEYYSL